MDFFTKSKAVKLRSHQDKYLIAGNDKTIVRQSRNGSSSSSNSVWFVEIDEIRSNIIRLKSCHGNYLTATDKPVFLGMTGNKVIQTIPYKVTTDWNIQWEPVGDGFQVKLKSWCGKYLRGNGGTPPWRNSVTHDETHGGGTHDWVLWDVVPVVTDLVVARNDLLAEYLSSMSSVSTVSEDLLEAASDYGSDHGSPVSVVSLRNSRLTMTSSMSPKLAPKQSFSSNHFRSGMEFFHKAKAVRLRSHHDKYLHADEDEDSVIQDRNGSSKNARWHVEFVAGTDTIIRLKSCYGKYLTASNQPFLLGMTGRKTTQTIPKRLDSSLEWEPVREGNQIKLKTRYGNFLRANGGLPPWRNSITHDIPHRTATQDWILWDVDVVEILVGPKRVADPAPAQDPVPVTAHLDSLDFGSSFKSDKFSRLESSDSYAGSSPSPPKSEGRTIYYHVADESGEVDDDLVEAYSLSFKGNSVDELSKKLSKETGLEDIVVCTRSPLNGKLYPLRLQLPPNNADMHVVVVQGSK